MMKNKFIIYVIGFLAVSAFALVTIGENAFTKLYSGLTNQSSILISPTTSAPNEKATAPYNDDWKGGPTITPADKKKTAPYNDDDWEIEGC